MDLLFRSIINRFGKNPMRGTLSILSIGIGVMILAIVFNINYRFSQLENESRLGVYTCANADLLNGDELDWKWPNQFTNDDTFQIKSEIPGVEHISRISTWLPNQIVYEGNIYGIRSLFAVDSDYFQMFDLEILAGDFFTDIIEDPYVTVISQASAEFLFSNPEEAIGKIILSREKSFDMDTEEDQIQTQPYRIIGVFKEVPFTIKEKYGLADVLIPYSILAEIHGDELSVFQVRTDKDKREISGELNQYLKSVHGDDLAFTLWEGNPEWYQEKTNFEETVRIASLFFGALGLIIFLVSAFGIFSMMMVSVLERNREVGLRRAIGSSQKKVIFLFITEAVFLDMAGSLVGILLACIFSRPLVGGLINVFTLYGSININNILNSSMALMPVIYALLISLTAAAAFAVFPAIQAARISPVESLSEG